MTIPASNIITRVQNTLLDPAPGVFWSTTELLSYLNAGISGLIEVKPDAYTITEPFNPVIGSVTQEIPDAGNMFMEATRNLSPSLSTINMIEKNHLDSADPNWPATQDTVIQNFMHDPRTPRIFYIYPAPKNSSMQIEIVYSVNPPILTDVSQVIVLDSIYETPLYYYVLGMAYAKNSKRQDIAKSEFYTSSFYQNISARTNMQFPLAPKIPERHP